MVNIRDHPNTHAGQTSDSISSESLLSATKISILLRLQRTLRLLIAALPTERPSPGLDPTQHPIDPQEQVLQRLITRAVPRDELPSLIESIFSGRKTNVVYRPRGSDARAIIDAMDEVHNHTLYFRGMVVLLLFLRRSFVQALNGVNLASHIRKKCVKMLYNTCARHTLFPGSLRIKLCDDPTLVLFRGGYGDVSKREYQGREVAVKRLRIYDTSDLQKVVRVGR